MQEEYYSSTEESEARFEAEQERLEKNPLYDLERKRYKFWEKQTDIGAKYLWLQYTKLKQPVPDEVMDRMIRVIEEDIERYKNDGKKRRSLPGSLSRDKIEKPVFDLLHCAKENPEQFWEILYPAPENKFIFHVYPDFLLNEARREFPQKKKLRPRELYEFFGKQIGLQIEEDGSDVGGRMEQRYNKTYKKNLAKELDQLELFKLSEEK
jgi:hypothetical protein